MMQDILIAKILQKDVADKILKNKAFDVAKDPQYDGYQRGLASMVYKFFKKKSASLADKYTKGSGGTAFTNKTLS